jgi:hypothetical protein
MVIDSPGQAGLEGGTQMADREMIKPTMQTGKQMSGSGAKELKDVFLSAGSSRREARKGAETCAIC